MSFVDFMILGAMKSGTTTLSQILSNHPDVCFCQIKEPHYFSKTSNWQKNIEDYKALYNPIGNQICGEASTTYTFYPKFNKNIWQSLYSFNPKLKFIYMMRDPVDRIVSQYMHNYLRGRTKESFEEVVSNQSSYINITRYFIQIKPYIELFGREQVLLLTFEEFIEYKKNSLNKIASFLGIDDSTFKNFDDVYANKSVSGSKRNVRTDDFAKNTFIQTLKPLLPRSFIKKTGNIIDNFTKVKIEQKPTVSEEMKKVIYDLLILDIREIEKLMGREIVEWKTIKNTEFSLKQSA